MARGYGLGIGYVYNTWVLPSMMLCGYAEPPKTASENGFLTRPGVVGRGGRVTRWQIFNDFLKGYGCYTSFRKTICRAQRDW